MSVGNCNEQRQEINYSSQYRNHYEIRRKKIWYQFGKPDRFMSAAMALYGMAPSCTSDKGITPIFLRNKRIRLKVFPKGLSFWFCYDFPPKWHTTWILWAVAAMEKRVNKESDSNDEKKDVGSLCPHQITILPINKVISVKGQSKNDEWT